MVTEKTCSQCNVPKALTEFGIAKKGSLGRSAQCRSCKNAKARARVNATPKNELSALRHAKYLKYRQQALAYGDKYRAARREWYKAHRRKPDVKAATARRVRLWLTRNADRHREWRRSYQAKHPEYLQRANMNRRARKANAPERETIDLVTLSKRDRWRCHICNGRVTKSTWSADHLIPLSKGGAHTWRNVALAHKRCNSRRHVGVLPAQLRLH